MPFTKNIHTFFQGPSNPGFRSVKIQTETFLKKDSRNFNFFFNLGSCEFLARLEGIIRKCLFFDGSLL